MEMKPTDRLLLILARQAWVGKVAPQGEISIPLEYTVEWPTGEEIEISG